MSIGRPTTTGHAESDGSWLDSHYQSARLEYEGALRSVGLRPGCRVLDAGCGGGGFLPFMSRLVGSSGSVIAVDLAPENISCVGALGSDCGLANVRGQVGSILDLPFADSSFDAVWSANVMQYFSEAECSRCLGEFKRVVRPGGIVAIKDFDAHFLRIHPIEDGVFTRFMTRRREVFEEQGLLGTFCGTSLPGRLRKAGLSDITRKGWFVERWAPVEPSTRKFVGDLIRYLARSHRTTPCPQPTRNSGLIWLRRLMPFWTTRTSAFVSSSFLRLARSPRCFRTGLAR